MKLTVLTITLIGAAMPLIAGNLPMTDDEKAWLKSVELIITPDERKAFKKECNTHLERKAFVDLFWAKRDENLDDDRNAFKEEYEARMDYVVTHYREFVGRPPRTDRGYVYMLLGKPDAVEYRTDPMLVGFNYRNPFPHFPAELWIYNDLDFGNGRRRALVQMVPKNSFGDYVALVDAQMDRLLRRIKYEFIVHPDLEEAPVHATSENLQSVDVVEAATSSAVPTRAIPVPTPTETTTTTTAFDTQAANRVGIAARSARFFSASGKTLTLIRVGFPTDTLPVDDGKEITLAFQLKYALTKEHKTIISDDQNQQLSFPNRAAWKRQSHYTFEVARMLEPGRYTLQIQLKDSKGELSYWQNQIDVEGFPQDTPAMTPVAIMDPDISLDKANFKLDNRPFTPKLSNLIRQGDVFYPIFEIVNQKPLPTTDDIKILLLSGDQTVKSWTLYPEEMTPLGESAMICHPEISTNNLKSGSYQFRAEVELTNGDILVSQTEIEVQKD